MPGMFLRSRVLVALLVAAFAAALAMGCGGSDEEPITKAAFVKQADAICSKAKLKQRAGLQSYIDKNFGVSGQDAEERLILNFGLPPLEEQLRELEELQVPAGDDEEIDAFLSEMDQALVSGRAQPQTLLSSADNPLAPVAEAAADYGFKVCGTLR
jgi:hypothetical protein